jgi:tetratricopeptide (TPR) repeat protein
MFSLLVLLAFQVAPAELQEAIRLQQAGQADAAIPIYERFLAARPGVLPIRSNLGAAYSSVGRYAEAQRQFEIALAAQPGDARVRLNLGLAFFKQNLIVEAAEQLERVYAAEPSSTQAVTLLADCYLMLGQNKKVITLLGGYKSGNLAHNYMLGTALIRDGQYAQGQVLVDQVLRAGESVEALYLLATTQMANEDNKNALATIERALALDPNFKGLHSLYGQAKLRDGNPEAARAAFQKELAANPLDFDANLYLGGLLRLDKEFEQSEPLLRRALQLRPTSLAVRYQLASLALGYGRAEEARAALEQIVKEDPDWIEPHITLATVYYRLKRNADGDRMTARVKLLNERNQAKELKKR